MEINIHELLSIYAGWRPKNFLGVTLYIYANKNIIFIIKCIRTICKIHYFKLINNLIFITSIKRYRERLTSKDYIWLDLNTQIKIFKKPFITTAAAVFSINSDENVRIKKLCVLPAMVTHINLLSVGKMIQKKEYACVF